MLLVALGAVWAIAVGIGAWWIARRLRGLEVALRREVSPGDRLPPTRELAEALDVNMHTVLRAYGDLRDEGLVDMRRRRGVIVREAARGRARVITVAAALATEARRVGMARDEVVALLEEVM